MSAISPPPPLREQSSLREQRPLREQRLDGQWRIRFDPDNVGKAEKWFSLPEAPAAAVPIIVPDCWQRIRPEGYDGVAWYWRAFPLPAARRGAVTLLEFGAVNYAAEVWINGRPVGRHEGGYTPFCFDVTEALGKGNEHLLAVRVLHPRKDGQPLEGLVLKELPCWREWESYTFGGLWQPVRLLNLPALYIADCFVQPDRDLKGAMIELNLCGAVLPETVNIETALFDAQAPEKPLLTRKVVARVERQGAGKAFVEGAGGMARVHLSIADPKPWSPDHPNLYLARVPVAAAMDGMDVVDQVETRFGLRWFSLENGQFILNGAPIFLHGGFHEGLYPNAMPIPPSKEFVEDEFAKAKAAGFNFLRYWQIPIHPTILDVADEMGMMLCEEPPIEWMTQTDKTVALCEREMRELVLRDRNRPSVVVWNILNEGGYIPLSNDFAGALSRAKPQLCRAARALDPTRLIIDESGSWHETARFYLPERDEAMAANDIHVYRPAPTPENTLEWFRAAGAKSEKMGRTVFTGGAPVFVSEFGYGGLPDFAAVCAKYEKTGETQSLDYRMHKALLESLSFQMRDRGLDRHFASVGEVVEASQSIQAEANYLQTMAIRANPLAAGYVLHAFSAGGIIAGAEVVDMWRCEKLAAAAMAEAQRPRLLCVFLGGPCSVEPGQDLKVEVVLANEGQPVEGASLEVAIQTPGGKTARTLAFVAAPAGVTPLWQGALPPLSNRPGACQILFRLSRGETLAEGWRSAWVVEKAEGPGAPAPCVAVFGDAEDRAVQTALRRMKFAVADNEAEAECCLVNLSGDCGDALGKVFDWARGGKSVLILAATANQVESALKAMRLGGAGYPATGHWSPVHHYFMDSELAKGLPQDRLLGQAYANVLPTVAIWEEPLPFRQETGSACFSYRTRGMALPREFWFAATTIHQRIGRGVMTLSTFQLAKNLEADPVARRLLFNLLARKG